MKLVKRTNFTKIYFDDSKKMTLDEWDNNEYISNEALKEVISELANTIRSYSPVYHIADNSNRKRVFEVEVQKWIASTLAEACASVGLKVFAIILPQELIAHLSTEQTADEAEPPPLTSSILMIKMRLFNG